MCYRVAQYIRLYTAMSRSGCPGKYTMIILNDDNIVRMYIAFATNAVGTSCGHCGLKTKW